MVVVYHGILPYERSRHVGLMEAYARRTDTVYVDPDAAAAGDGIEHALAPHLFHVAMPAVLPGGRLRPLGRWNRWLGMRRILARVRERIGAPVVLVCQQPDLLPTLRGLPADIKIYEVRDDYAGFAADAASAERIARAHRRLLDQADVVWAISESLVEDIRPLRADVERTDVGVEYETFARADPRRAPAALREIPGPRIALIGNLNDRVDWELLETLARVRPDWQVVLIGPLYRAGAATEDAVRRLQELRNVHLLPPVARAGLADAVASIDVGLIPYRLTPATRRINPLKLYQYLAAGVPVVASAIPAIARIPGAAAIAEKPAEFFAAIECALRARHDPDACAARRALASRFDWQAIADRQLEIAQTRLRSACATRQRARAAPA